MRRSFRITTTVMGIVVFALAVAFLLNLSTILSHKSLGTRLQDEAGDRYEVIYNPRTQAYTVEPKNEPRPMYLCHTFTTWDSRNYADFTTEVDGRTVACLEAGDKQ